MNIVIKVLKKELKVELEKLCSKHKEHSSEFESDFKAWCEDPCYDLSFGTYDKNDEYIQIVTNVEIREIENLQKAIWASETAFDDARKYKEIISTIKTIKTAFLS